MTIKKDKKEHLKKQIVSKREMKELRKILEKAVEEYYTKFWVENVEPFSESDTDKESNDIQNDIKSSSNESLILNDYKSNELKDKENIKENINQNELLLEELSTESNQAPLRFRLLDFIDENVDINNSSLDELNIQFGQ